MTKHDIELSVVIPVYNEAASIGPLCERLTAVLERITPDWEIVFIDDGSLDGTADAIRAQNAREPRVGAVSFSRNFGKEIAIAAGLDHARGRAVVIMDADLQHPPEMIPAFVEKWREGYTMVYGLRTSREGEGPIKRRVTHLFYRMMDRFGETHLPEDAGDFRLIDRKGVEILRSLGERARFSKGLYAWIGFKAIGIPFSVEQRRHGTTKWSARKLFRFAFDGITSFSTIPLRVWTYLGILISFFALASAVYFICEALFLGVQTPGFPTVIVSIMFFAGVQLMSLGIIGEYIGRIFAEVKRRPLYIVQERIGGPAEAGDNLIRDDRRLARV